MDSSELTAVFADLICLAALHAISAANNRVLGRDALIKDFLLVEARRSPRRPIGNEMESR